LTARTARTCGGPAKHKWHGGSIQVLSGTAGWPIWVSGVRPGREHGTTCAKAAKGLMPALEQAAAEGVPALTGLGYEGLAGPELRMPVKKTSGIAYHLGREPKTASRMSLIAPSISSIAWQILPDAR
jgi:hypothetical protein